MSSAVIFGAGNMGTAIGGVLSRGGVEVEHRTSGDPVAPISGELVVLAVPYPAIAGIVEAYGSHLDGKTVVDISNPLDFSTFDRLVVPTGSSATAELAAQLPGAKVLKAFNTTFAATVASGKVGQVDTTVLVAGDHDAAKADLIAAITTGGLSAIDAGGLQRAHELEAVGFLQLTLAVAGKLPWTAGFAVVS